VHTITNVSSSLLLLSLAVFLLLLRFHSAPWENFPLMFCIVCMPLATLFVPARQNGFFASAGPVDIFVSQYGLPGDLVFDACGSAGTPMLHSQEEDVRIEIGTEVRIKLQGVRMNADNITVLGTIKEDFLG
jgi:DNA-directed RNA polymerase II subunit RPB7